MTEETALSSDGSASPCVGTDEERALLGELTLLHTPGLGPVLATRLVERVGGPGEAGSVSQACLREIAGIGASKAAAIRSALPAAREAAQRELERARSLGVDLVSIEAPHYPALLRAIPNPPRVLFVRGRLPGPSQAGGGAGEWHGLGIVGTRRCTAYGIEQGERFSSAIAGAGIVIVSGGARGIDTAAHRAALRVRGITVAVLGCGLAHDYPPENRPLFERIAGEGGAVISELPLDTPPVADNFPARNRIISGLSLGVLVIEAPKRSGSLITAREAVEQHGREVLVVPGRVDSPASAGSLELIRDGAALVACPGDVIGALEAAARHQFEGTHAIFTGRLFDEASESAADDFSPDACPEGEPDEGSGDDCDRAGEAADEPTVILRALSQSGDPDAIARTTGLAAHRIRAHLTMLELTGRVVRRGTRFELRTP
ncbi:MAG: DNA-processing protein DprA [Phycisphaerales bacterium]